MQNFCQYKVIIYLASIKVVVQAVQFSTGKAITFISLFLFYSKTTCFAVGYIQYTLWKIFQCITAGVKVALCNARQRIRVYAKEQATMLKHLIGARSHKKRRNTCYYSLPVRRSDFENHFVELSIKHINFYKENLLLSYIYFIQFYNIPSSNPISYPVFTSIL